MKKLVSAFFLVDKRRALSFADARPEDMVLLAELPEDGLEGAPTRVQGVEHARFRLGSPIVIFHDALLVCVSPNVAEHGFWTARFPRYPPCGILFRDGGDDSESPPSINPQFHKTESSTYLRVSLDSSLTLPLLTLLLSAKEDFDS